MSCDASCDSRNPHRRVVVEHSHRAGPGDGQDLQTLPEDGQAARRDLDGQVCRAPQREARRAAGSGTRREQPHRWQWLLGGDARCLTAIFGRADDLPILLHALVLRKVGLAARLRTPKTLSSSWFFCHLGTGPARVQREPQPAA